MWIRDTIVSPGPVVCVIVVKLLLLFSYLGRHGALNPNQPTEIAPE